MPITVIRYDIFNTRGAENCGWAKTAKPSCPTTAIPCRRKFSGCTTLPVQLKAKRLKWWWKIVSEMKGSWSLSLTLKKTKKGSKDPQLVFTLGNLIKNNKSPCTWSVGAFLNQFIFIHKCVRQISSSFL